MRIHSVFMAAVLIFGSLGSAATAHHSKTKGNQPLLVPVVEDDSLLATPVVKATTAIPVAKPQKTPLTTLSFRQRHLQALDLAMAGKNSAALEILNSLAQTSIPADELDRVYMSIGRIEYQAGNFNGSIEALKKVRRGSPSWLESLEERAWANLRLGQSQEALATLKTVLAPIFQDRVRTESYFMAAYAELRVCDFQAVLQTIDLFKTRFRGQVKGWESAKTDAAAQTRLTEISDTIQKLNLVEAEVIQRLYIDESGKPMKGAPPKIDRAADQLSFPMNAEQEAKELWLDEVDDYRVTVKGCPQSAADATPGVKKAGVL